MIRKKLFIGSSSEEIELAKAAKVLLERDFDVSIWNEKLWDNAVFRLNESFLSDLLKASLKYDFGILIGTQDDKVEIRGTEVMKPRDNVLFELGLFTGRLGMSKCAFLIDKKIDILSDFSGVSLARFSKGDGASFDAAVEQVRRLFLQSSDDDLNFFPSATLAAVYYENFIVPVCRHLIESKGLKSRSVYYRRVRVNVIIPNRINEDVNLQWERMKSTKFVTYDEEFQYNGRARKLLVDATVKGEILELLDCPTILTGINHSIQNLLPREFEKGSTEYDFILERELLRFIYTLKRLLLRGGFDGMVAVKRESDL